MLSLEQIKELVKDKLKNYPKRWIHTLGVVEMATYLAKIYGVDETKAAIAAYMHDYAKYDRPESLIGILQPNDLRECESYPVLYHSYGSAEYYRKRVGTDPDIYNAIRNHVFGRLNMSKLEEIILVSDYTEKNRTYEMCVNCRKLLLEGKFNEVIYQSTQNTIEFILKNGQTVHPVQYDVLNYYKELCK